MSEKPSRFSQAQLLIAALFAVVFTGEMPEDSPLSPTHRERQPYSRLFGNGKKYRGVLTTVSKQLGVSEPHVSAVASGRRKSAAIAKAIREEMDRVDNIPAGEAIQPLTGVERREFQHGGRYRGLAKVVATSRGLHPSAVYSAIRCPESSRATFLALRAAMAEIDARRKTEAHS